MDQINFVLRRSPRIYSDEFKLAVIEDYLRSGQSKEAIYRKYDIRSHSALVRWLHEFRHVVAGGKKDNFVVSTPADLFKKKDTSDSVTPSAQEQISQLKKQLEDEQLRSAMYLRMIEIAETEYNIPIRKKPDTK